jgi:uncharacterized protein (DUF983 family)
MSEAGETKGSNPYDCDDNEPVGGCPHCGALVRGYYWKKNKCPECGKRVR